MVLADIDELLNGLQRMLSDLVRVADEGGVVKIRRRESIGNGLSISTNISVRVGLLEGEKDTRQHLSFSPAEPIVDVFDRGDELRVVALLPGIRREDVNTRFENGTISVEIRRRGQVHYASLPCNLRPDEVTVESISTNNSVLEIVFKRRRGTHEHLTRPQ